MRFTPKVAYVVNLKVAAEMRSRLEHHAKRLGVDMVDICRDGLAAQLDILDEKEEIELARKRARQHPWGKPKGLGRGTPVPIPDAKTMFPSFLNMTKEVKVPEKLKKSFRRWAEYLEAAEDKSDAAQRTNTILQDINERTTDSAEAKLCFEEFEDFLKARMEAKASTKSEVVEAKETVDIAGDV